MLVRVLYHDHCFDGAASAAIFSRFIKEAVHPDAEFRYTGMAHKADQTFDPALFDGDEKHKDLKNLYSKMYAGRKAGFFNSNGM